MHKTLRVRPSTAVKSVLDERPLKTDVTTTQ